MTKPTIDSFDLEGFVDQMARLVELPIAPAHRSGVLENFERIIGIAHLVNEFPLPMETEAAPVFEPEIKP